MVNQTPFLQQFKPFFRFNHWLSCLFLAIATLILILRTPALALDIQVNPPAPRLGDTLVVRVTQPNAPSDAPAPQPPSVIFEGTTYPMFPVAPNQYRVLLPTTPLDQPGTKPIQIINGSQQQTVSVTVANREFPTQSIWLPPDKGDIIGTDLEFDRVAAFKKLVTPQQFWQGPFLRPNVGSITTIYGVRRYYNGEFAENYYHRGVDYAAATGSPVVAPAAGRVAIVGLESAGFELHGNTVGLDHGQGVTSIYLHLSRIDVKEGDMVQPGQVIGAVGSTGISTGPHLHWGLYVHGEAVDPVPWRYDGVN